MNKRDEEKVKLRVRIDDLIMEMHMLKMVKPKLYYKLLPHLEAMKKELIPYWKRWFK